MPRAAPRPCTYPGCRDFAAEGARCAKHAHQLRKEIDSSRGSARERGYTTAWTKARSAYLRAHPLCVQCEADGALIAASVVDHKVPHRGDKSLFWDRTNWQSLCKRHHDIKTAREDGGFGNRVGGVSNL